MTISSRTSAPRTPTIARKTSSSIPSPSSARTLPRRRRPAARRSSSAIRIPARACVEKIVSNLAHHAWRRPVTKAETASLLKFVAMAKANGQSTEQGIQLALQAMLVSPHFLFRIEHDPNPLDAAEGASDQRSRTGIAPELLPVEFDARRRTARPRRGRQTARRRYARCPGEAHAGRPASSSALADNFAGQWLELRNLDVVKPDPQKFPDWSPELRDAMKQETRLFFDDMLRENRPSSEFPGRPLHFPE